MVRGDAHDGNARSRSRRDPSCARAGARRLVHRNAEQRASPRPRFRTREITAAVPAGVATPRPAAGDRPRACAADRCQARGCGDDPQARAPQVKLIDTNLLLYAVDEGSPHHKVSKPWFEQQLSGSETVAFGWAALLAFV